MRQRPQFGQWLRKRRNALDLAQWELAERVGCSSDTIQKIESGTRRPSKQVAELLADRLGIAPGERAAFVNWARLGYRSISPPSMPMSEASRVPSAQDPVQPVIPTNLPTPLTSLVGREHAIEAVCGYLSRDDVRLLSLLGPPGVGKTRLSIASAAALTDVFTDGVHFVPLETLSDPTLVTTAVSETLKLRPLPGQSLQDAVQAHLRDRRILLVLDNFEQVLDAGLQVTELIRACPGLKVLVTSREALRVYGEWRFVVKPLKLPDVSRLSELKPDAVSNAAAVALFTERAQAVKSELAFTRRDLELIAKICARLDGLPLAIELAATRVSSLSLKQILSGLGQLNFLQGNLRNLPSRQRTIRGAIDWSYHMLPESERTLLRRMGVFAGGCTQAAVEAVCDSSDLRIEFEVLDGCQSLIEKSLLRHQAGKAGEDGEDRYAMLEVIREYAVEQLQASGEEDQIRRRHAQYYLTLVEAAAPQLDGPMQARALQALEADNDNIRAALAWAVKGGRATVEIALCLSGALGRFWDMRGYAIEGRRWLEQALMNAAQPVHQDDGAVIDRSATETISPLVRIKALMAAGRLGAVQGERLAARSFYRQALEVAQAAGHRPSIGSCLMNLASASNRLGEYAEAMDLFEQALLIFRELGDKPLIGRALVNMGFCARSQGDNAKARALYEESLALRREVGDQYGIALTLGNLGQIAVDRGDHAAARVLLQASLSIRREIRNEQGIAFCLTWLARVDHAEHHFPQAVDLFQQGLRLYQNVGDRESIAACLEWLPELCNHVGMIEQGVKLWGAAETLRHLIGVPISMADRARYDRAVVRAREELGEQVFARAWAEGNQLTTEDAIDYALELILELPSRLSPEER